MLKGRYFRARYFGARAVGGGAIETAARILYQFFRGRRGRRG